FEHLDVAPQILLERVEQRFVRRQIVKRLAGRANDTDGLLWHQYADRALGGVELDGDDFTQLRALRRGSAHQRYLRVVLIEISSLEFRWHSFRRTKIHHVQA